MLGALSVSFNCAHNFACFIQDHSWINESVRNILIGSCENNVAKANNNYGFYFENHLSGKQVKLRGLKAIKNRYRGIFLYASYNMSVSDSIFSDNARNGMEVRWVDNLQIKNTLIRGHSAQTKALVQAPYFNKPGDGDFLPSVGLSIPTAIWSPGRTDDIGATITNVQFTDFDHSDEYEASVPMNFRLGDNRITHFDYVTMFKNVTIDGTKIMDAPPTDQPGINDIVIHDIDGSADPSGQSSQAGMFVSSVEVLKKFAGGSCNDYPTNITYCSNSCYRTIRFSIDPSFSSAFEVLLTRNTDGLNVTVPFLPYKYEDNEHLQNYFENNRVFSVSLPEGSFSISIMNNQEPVYPRFVLPFMEGKPECEGYVSYENITIYEPPSECDDWVANGDMELGTPYWRTLQGNTDTQYGQLIVAEGAGINNSTAIKHIKRASVYHGIGQHLDTRCIHQSLLNEYYEIRIHIRLEQNNVTFICDPYTGSWDTRCPILTFQMKKIVDDKTQTTHMGSRALVVPPNNIGDFNLMHGVFKVDENLISQDRIYAYIELVDKKFDMIVDDISVKKLPSVCGNDLIRNGDLEDTTVYWKRWGNGRLDIDIDTSNNKSIKVHSRLDHGVGVYQDLYVEEGCLKKQQRFSVICKYLISSNV